MGVPRAELNAGPDPVLPLVSLAALAAGGAGRRGMTALADGCERVGFFLLEEHDVPLPRIAEALEAADRFFALPSEVKARFAHDRQTVTPSTARGYIPLYGETLQVDAGADPKEVFDLGLERDDSRPFQGRTVLPTDHEAPGFARTMLALQEAVIGGVIPPLVRSFETLLRLPPGALEAAFETPTLIQRVIHYPPGVGFAGAHTDNGLFTLLIQEPAATPSLSVQSDGRWIDVPADPDRIVVNLGDMLQLLTGGRFVSTPHRVRHAGRQRRLSLPFFVYPDIDSILPAVAGGAPVSTFAVMSANFRSIWETGGGAGRAPELA